MAPGRRSPSDLPRLSICSTGRCCGAAPMKLNRQWLARIGAAVFAVFLLYPFTALFVNIGPWQWAGDVRNPALASVRVSLLLTSLAMVVIVALGTPVAVYIARCTTRERLVWQAVLLVPILLPPLALGILLTLALGPYGSLGTSLEHYGVMMTNSATAFVVTQVYVGMGYYVLGAVAALDAVPVILQKQAALLGLTPAQVFSALPCLSPALDSPWLSPLHG